MWRLVPKEEFAQLARATLPELADAFLNGNEFFVDDEGVFLSLTFNFPESGIIWVTGLWAKRGKGFQTVRDLVKWAQSLKDYHSIGFTMDKAHPWRDALFRYYKGEISWQNDDRVSWVVKLDSKRLQRSAS